MDKYNFFNELLRIKQIDSKDRFNDEIDKLKDKLEVLYFNDKNNDEIQYFSTLLDKFLSEQSLSKDELIKNIESYSEILREAKNMRHQLNTDVRKANEELKKIEIDIDRAELNIRIYEDLKSITN